MSNGYKFILKCYFSVNLLFAFYQSCFSQCAATVNQVNSQTLCNGSTTVPVNLSGRATRYTWTNSNTSIGLAASGTGNIPSFTAVNNGNTPISATVTVTPVQDALVYIVKNGSNAVTVINTFNNSIVATIPVGADPVGICVSPDNTRVFVTNSTSNSVSVINTLTNRVVSTVSVGTNPQGVAIAPDGSYVYVTNSGSNNVSVINTATNTVASTIPVGATPYGIAVTPDGSKILVANYGSNTVSVITYFSVSATISVGSGPIGIAIMPYGDQVYVTNQNSNTLSRIYLPNNAVVATMSGFSEPTGVVATNARIYIANSASNTVSVIDYYTETIIANVGVGSNPISVDLVPGGNSAYVTNLFGNSVSIINLSNNTVTSTISAATYPISFGKFIASGCSGSPITFKITVHPTPSVNAIANQSVCGGNTQPEISLSGTGTIYSWVNSNPSIGLAASGTGNIPSFTSINNGNTPITANITVTPRKQPLAYFASNNNVVVVNTTNNTTVATIPVGNNPKAIAISPDGRKVYVTTVDNGKLAVINTLTNTVDTNITIGNSPSSVVISPNGTRVYVAFSPNGITYNGAIRVVNTTTNAIIATVNTSGKDPRVMMMSLQGGVVYIPLFGSAKIDILSTSSNTIYTSVPTLAGPYCSALNPDGSRLYVACATANRVWMMNTSSLTAAGSIPVGTQPQGLYVNSDGIRVYVTNFTSNNVSVINTTNYSVSTINGFSSPFGIAATADGSKVYVCNNGSSAVSVINPANNSVSSIPFAASVPSFGNFVHQINNCPGPPVQFTITVNSPASATMATANNTMTLPVSQKTFFSNACTNNLICAVNPNGLNPVNGTVTAKVWVETTQPAQFVKRHYEIIPATNATTATGKVTLYFTQAEFTTFNSQLPAPALLLPTGLADAVGIANLRIEKRPGTSSDGTGLPSTYVGTPVTINPADVDIVWNATLSRWEVTFDATGFSGFWVKTQTAVLPLQWLNVRGKLNANKQATISWQVQETNVVKYEIEKSSDGRTFTRIGFTNSKGDGTNDYTFIEYTQLNGINYYRIKQINIDGKYTYSSIIKLNNSNTYQISIYPNPAKDLVTINGAKIGSNLILTDLSGKLLLKMVVTQNSFTIDIAKYASGIYLLKTDEGFIQKLFKE